VQRFRIFHQTEYNYGNKVLLGPHKILVRPRDGHDIRIEKSRLEFDPPALVSWHRDELDNSVALATFDETPVTRLVITSEVVVTHYLSSRTEPPLLDHIRRIPFAYTAAEALALGAYRNSSAQGAEFDNWLGELMTGTADTLQFLQDLNKAINTSCNYQERHEEGVQAPEQTLATLTGSCRDYAWLYVVAARQAGFAARFVSGYFHTEGTSLGDGHTHAWAEVYLPGAGWTGFDPTCNVMTAENHVPVAVALLPDDIPPVSGLFTGHVGESQIMTVRVNVNLC
jgi:transglutaminase-like putative cysteine protease